MAGVLDYEWGRIGCSRSFISTWNDILSCCACIHVRSVAHLAPVAREHPAPGVRASLHHPHIISRASNMQLRTRMRAQLQPCAPPSALTHACMLCLPHYRPFLVRILEPGSDLGVYHHLLAEMRRLSRCDEAGSAAVQIAGAGETESPMCCSSCPAGMGGSRSQLFSTMHALLLKFALHKLDRSMLLHQIHAQ